MNAVLWYEIKSNGTKQFHIYISKEELFIFVKLRFQYFNNLHFGYMNGTSCPRLVNLWFNWIALLSRHSIQNRYSFFQPVLCLSGNPCDCQKKMPRVFVIDGRMEKKGPRSKEISFP